MATLPVPAFLGDGGQLGALIRAKSWQNTPLGAPDTWPQPLKTLVGLMLVANQPMFIAWGREQLFLYNDPYIEVLANKHPWALGRPFREVWSEIWPDIEPLADKVFSGEPVHMEDISLVMVRRGKPEETHFAFSYTPVLDADGSVAGLFCACIETTVQVLAERRQAFRLELETVLRAGETLQAILPQAMAALCRHLGASGAGFGTVAPSQASIQLTTDQAGTVSLPVSALGGALFQNKPIVVEGEGESGDGEGGTAPPEGWATLGLQAFVGLPMQRGDRTRALLYVGSTSTRPWTPEEIELLDYVANRLWDAAERDAAEAALRESEAHLAGIFAQPGAGFAETDMDGRFLSVNDTYCALTGIPREELLRTDKLAVTYVEDRDATRQVLARVRTSGEPVTIEKRYRHPDGRLVWVSNTISPIRATKGGTSLLTVAIDVSERKQVELDLADAKDQAEQANLAKSNFIANMSHELRTPLSAIIGFSEMLQEEMSDGGNPGAFVADMGKIETNARHLLGLINDVLDLSKIESGKMEVYPETFDVSAAVHEVAATVDNLVGKKGNELVLELGAGLGTAHTDVVKLRQVLLNLLSNAAKFTEAGTITLSAHREQADGADMLVFAVRDSGIGMTADQLAKLFQRFTQADASTTRRFGGTGLGLSITKAFTAMMGGSIGVDSTLGQGSTFTARIPADLPDTAPVSAHAQPARHSLGMAEEAPPHETVLVIDDDPAQRELMTRFLEREGFAARTAEDGRTGLALAAELHPRAILLDVTMPGLDGWSVLRTLKADPALADIPVVMVTFINDNGLAMTLGAADHVTKPVKWDSFRLVMDRFRDGEGDVLVVDDNPDTRYHLRHALERDGWTVTEAANGRDALDRVAHALPKVVLLDLEMPVMDGFAFLHAFRDRPGCRDIPVVVITARDLTGADRQALKDASRVLSKTGTSLKTLSRELQAITHSDGQGGRM